MFTQRAQELTLRTGEQLGLATAFMTDGKAVMAAQAADASSAMLAYRMP